MSDSFRLFVLEQLRGLGPVLCKSMFGGFGLYQEGRFFGIIHKGCIFFKVSEKSKPLYEEAGAEPFSPSKKQTITSFYEVPSDVIESPPRAVEWAREAVKAAALKTSPRPAMSPDHILTGHAFAIQALSNKLRAIIKQTVPDAQERAYPGWHAIGYRHPKAGYFCGVFPYKDEVKVYFEHGARLPDPEGILEGSQKQVRILTLRRPTDIPAKAFRSLLLAAVALCGRNNR